MSLIDVGKCRRNGIRFRRHHNVRRTRRLRLFCWWTPLGSVSYLLFQKLYIHHVIFSWLPHPGISACARRWIFRYPPPPASKRLSLLFSLPSSTPLSLFCTSGRPHITPPMRLSRSSFSASVSRYFAPPRLNMAKN